MRQTHSTEIRQFGPVRASKPTIEGVILVDIDPDEASSETGMESVGEVDAVNGGDTLLTVHRIATRLFESGAFDKATIRQFDELCLTPVKPMEASDIRVFEKLQVSAKPCSPAS